MTEHTLEQPAMRVVAALQSASPHAMPVNVLRIEQEAASIVFDLDGASYKLSLSRVPSQRKRGGA